MSGKIFRISFFTSMLVLAAALVLIVGILFDFFETQLETELSSEAQYLSHGVETEGSAFLDGFTDSDRRITWIAPDGGVIYDNRADADTLDNHAQREEISQARETGTGKSVRYSNTLLEKTVYYAARLSDGSVLRISTNQYTVVRVLLGILQPIFVVLALAFVLSLVLSFRVSKTIVKPINALDLNHPENNDVYEELTPLLQKIHSQNRTIRAQLAEAEKKREEFRLITENMREGLLTIDRDANLLTYNPAAVRILGMNDAQTGSVLSLCREKNFRAAVQTVLSGTAAEIAITQKERIYSLIANPTFDGEKLIGAVLILIDVTEQKRQEALRREFTANVSHELKTPLTSISGFAELMKNGGIPDDTVADFSKSIYEEAQRLITLIGDIIELSELDEKEVLSEEEPVELRALSAEILKRLSGEAEKKGVSLNVIGSEATVTGNRRILDEMIYNLCDNAIKYNRENGSVDVLLSTSEDTVSLAVRDTGIGIPPEHQERVFERFYRVDKSRSKCAGGTGLGLAIVKHGALCHHADIRLSSTVGKGTEITLVFHKEN